MSEHDEKRYSFEDVTGSDWWIHQISELPNWRPGGVFLICTGPNSSVLPAGAWFYTAACLSNNQDGPLFPEIILVTPPGTKQLSYRDRFKDAITHSFENSGREIPKPISRCLNAADWPWVESDAEKILADLERLPEGSAVSVIGAERLRFSNMEGRTGPLVLTHTGHRISHSSADDLMLPHLHELLRRLLKLAVHSSFSIVVFAENFDFEMDKLPEDLKSHEEFGVCSVHYGDLERARFRAKTEALRISRTDGLESAIQFAHQNIPDVLHQAHALGFIYGDHGLWTESWRILEGHVDELRAWNEPHVLLNLAQSAAACGEAKKASECLAQAFGLGLDTVESFNSAAMVAQSISAKELLDQIVAEMRTAYPHHRFTVSRSFGRLMKTGRYLEAAEMADAAGFHFEGAWARLCEQKAPDWEVFIKVGHRTGRLQDALAKCVVHALDIGESGHARKFFKDIPETVETAVLRAELLFEIVIKDIGFVELDADLEQLQREWSSIFSYLASTPRDSDLRNRISHWFESSSDERSRIVFLITCCMNAFKRAAALFEPDNATNEVSPWSFSNMEENAEKAQEFMEAVAATSSAPVFGRAVVPVEYSNGVSDDVMAGLGILVHAFTKDPNAKGIGSALQCLNLACRIRREPTWDFEAAIQLSGSLASHGKVSEGLNLAESVLQFWGKGSGEFESARNSHAWSCMAEVYHRARNPLTSLFYFIVCLESMTAQPARQHAGMLKHKLRLATRILRDLSLSEFAGNFLIQEVKLIQAFPKGDELKEWTLTEISCRLGSIRKTTSQKEVQDMISNIQSLLENENETEWEPPVSAAVSLLDILRHHGFPTPQRLADLVVSRLPKCSQRSQRLFRHAFSNQPTLSEIQAAIHDLLQGNVHDDQAYGFSVIEGLLRRAVRTACDKDDAELFGLAATWLSQPALAASRSRRELSFEQPEARLASLSEILATENSLDTQQIMDYAAAVQRQAEKMQSNFTLLENLPIGAFGYVAAPDESLCFLAHDAGDNLCRLIVRRGNINELSRLPKSKWDIARYSEWIKKFPRCYSWNQLFGYDIPPENDIRHSLKELQPQIPTNATTVTILPEADLFGFTYFLTDAPSGWVGQATICVTAPSITWLATVRRLERPKLKLKAWLGHPTRADRGVMEPRAELEPIILKSGGTLIDSDSPRQMGSAGVSVILSHGSEGAFGSFAGVNDVGQFTNEDLAGWLGESACVILFVCNAGRNESLVLNQETVGLVGQLLRRGVRAVLAPPAPLRNDLPSLWFTPFIDSLRQGKTVGQASANASAVVRNKFSHPCAWGALQLFGDAQLAFIVEPLSKDS